MRLEGAQNPDTDAGTLAYLAGLGYDGDDGSPVVLAAMVRRAVALNPSCDAETIRLLSEDRDPGVRAAAEAVSGA